MIITLLVKPLDPRRCPHVAILKTELFSGEALYTCLNCELNFRWNRFTKKLEAIFDRTAPAGVVRTDKEGVTDAP